MTTDRDIEAQLRTLSATISTMVETQDLHTKLLQLVVGAATDEAAGDDLKGILERIEATLASLARDVDVLRRSSNRGKS